MNSNLVKESVIQTVAGQNYSHNFDISDIANVFFIAKVIDSKNRVYQSKLVVSK
jgi:hypothetical protein